MQGTGLCLDMTVTVTCAVGSFLVHITVTTVVRIELRRTAAGDNFSVSQYMFPVFDMFMESLPVVLCYQ